MSNISLIAYFVNENDCVMSEPLCSTRSNLVVCVLITVTFNKCIICARVEKKRLMLADVKKWLKIPAVRYITNICMYNILKLPVKGGINVLMFYFLNILKFNSLYHWLLA